jgi:hypothetical protein
METKKPIQTFRDGAVGASVWLKQTRAGVFYDVTFSRSYKNEETGKSGYADNFSDRHLPSLIKVAGEALAYIEEKKANAETVTLSADAA